MRYLPADKYNIAWFKLAECVSRGEKERALGVYRLLSHSLDDAAFVYQLEADIFLAFGDTAGAIQRYVQALEIYKSEERFFEAAAIAEHLFQLTDDKLSYAQRLSSMYEQLAVYPKAWEYGVYVMRHYIAAGDLTLAYQTLDALSSYGDIYEQYALRRELLFACIQERKTPHEILVAQARKLIDLALMADDKHEVQQLFAELEYADHDLYTAVCSKQ